MDLRIALMSDADKYRVQQARELLAEAGYIEQPNGTWLPGAVDLDT